MKRSSNQTMMWARWTAVVVWAGIIFAGSSRPGSTLPGGYSVQGHLGEYFVFGMLLCWALRPSRAAGIAAAAAVVVASLYGFTDEFHQHFVPGRTPDVTDWGLDTIGALVGALAMVVVLTQVARHSRRGHGAGAASAHASTDASVPRS